MFSDGDNRSKRNMQTVITDQNHNIDLIVDNLIWWPTIKC